MIGVGEPKKYFIARWNQCKKVNAETVPIDLAQAGYFDLDVVTGHIKNNAVSDVELQRFSDTFL